MTVGAYALTTIDKAKNYLRLSNESLYANALSVQGTGDGTAYTVAVTATAVVLVKTGGTGPGTDTLLFSASVTLTTMAAAINALAGGYTANVLGVGAADIADLVVVSATACKTSAVTLQYVNDYLLERLIDSASARVESLCERKFASRSYAEYYDGTGTSELYLDYWPVTAIARLSLGREYGLGIRCTASGATWASIRNDGTNLILIYDTASGTTTTNLALGTYTTITLLAAAITATGSWTVVDLSKGTWLTADLCQTPALYALDEYAYLELPYKAESAWRFESDTGRLILENGASFTGGKQNIYIEYTAGYSTIPFDLEETAHALVARMYAETRRDAGLSSERLGDYAWTAKEGGEPEKELLSKLQNYRRIGV